MSQLYIRQHLSLILISTIYLLIISTHTVSSQLITNILTKRRKRNPIYSSLRNNTTRKLHSKKGPPKLPNPKDNSWKGCLGYSYAELKEKWIFHGPMPDCPGVTNDDDQSGGGGSHGGGSGSGGSSSGGSGSGGSGSGGSGSGGSGSGGSGSGGSGSGGSGGGGEGGNDDGGSGGGSGGNDDGDSGMTNYNDDHNNGNDDGDDNSNGNNNDDDANNGGDDAYDDDDANNGIDDAFGNNDDDGDDDDIGDAPDDDAYYTYFNINDCDSYSDYWLWDLALTCENEDYYENCSCMSAATLLANGVFKCPGSDDDAPYCPENCSICNTCMALIGCSETQPYNVDNPKPKSQWLLYAVGAVTAVLLTVGAVVAHSTLVPEPAPMETNLLAAAAETDNVWLAPAN